MYPRTAGNHPVGAEFGPTTRSDEFLPGMWNYKWEREMDHLDINLSPEAGQLLRQENFYRELFVRLAGLPASVQIPT